MTQSFRSATIFSLAAEPPGALADQADPHSRFDAATLFAGEARHPCSLHKLSAAGATLRLDMALEPGATMQLELANGLSVAGTVAWCSDGEAGLHFAEPIDVIGTIARNLVALPAERRDMPRVEIVQTIHVRAGSKVELARTRNISQGGAGIETRLDLTPGEPVQLIFDSLRPLDGTVRWVRGSQAGIEFAEELGWQTLMPWLRHAQRMPAAADAPAEREGMIPDKHAIRLDAPASVREGARWWNARVRGLTAQLVELETGAGFRPGAQLWISLPQIGGGPAAVIEAGYNRVLCEFRLPLRPHELGLLGGRMPPQAG